MAVCMIVSKKKKKKASFGINDIRACSSKPIQMPRDVEMRPPKYIGEKA